MSNIVEDVENLLVTYNVKLEIPTVNVDKYLSFIDSEDTKKIVTLLTNDSKTIKDIINIVELIMKDGKIDISDTPLLISFIKKLITIKSDDMNGVKDMNTIIKIIKIVLVILAKENVLKVPNVDQFITDISKLLDDVQMVEEVGSQLCGYCCKK